MTEDPVLMAWRRLGCAILTRALRDAADGSGYSGEAIGFLKSHGARHLVALLDLDPALLKTPTERVPDVLAENSHPPEEQRARTKIPSG
jgi:hypothetical protein